PPPQPPISTLFPYTTLFRSMARVNRHWNNALGVMFHGQEQAVDRLPMRVGAQTLGIVFEIEEQHFAACTAAAAPFGAQRHVELKDRKSTRLNSSHLGNSYAV